VNSVLVTLRFQKNHKIVVEGDPGSSFYLIKKVHSVYWLNYFKGPVAVYKNKKLLRVLNQGESFGEQALYYT